MPSSKTPLPVKAGDRILVEMPHSEVCMHMRIAGKPMTIEIVKADMWGHVVQIYDREGRKFSVPILTCEAGVYGYGEGMYVYPYLNREESPK